MEKFTNLTLLSLIIRIFQPHAEKVAFVYGFTALIICYYIAIIFVKIFICWPIRAYWQDWRNAHTTQRCLNRPAVIIADSSISVVTDLAILIFPLVLSWSLHMPPSKKAGVVTILGAGCIAIGFSLYRLILVSLEFDTPNAEGGLGLICACLPPLNKLIREIARKRLDPKRRVSDWRPRKRILRVGIDLQAHNSRKVKQE
ncbi:hypothetical protein BDV59DRAFT_211781 [Aspergillus ambiguus]|uniref:uncharacterized protein n=1 Tax=Aspergillus ambiguus TaxID=176160 RepID=UPI003CCD7455